MPTPTQPTFFIILNAQAIGFFDVMLLKIGLISANLCPPDWADYCVIFKPLITIEIGLFIGSHSNLGLIALSSLVDF